MKKVKICGLKRPEDIELVNRYKPDYCGFIINFPKSHRNLSPERVRELKQGLSKEIKAVGVFVNQPVEVLAELLEEGTIDIAQLHGTEDRAYIDKLRSLTDKTIWQAFQIRSEDDIMKAMASEADFVLLDAGQGSGEVFDWSGLKLVTRPFGLAGGLKAENLPEALTTEAVLLDVSGGVETEKFKDEEKVRNFIEEVRKVERL